MKVLLASFLWVLNLPLDLGHLLSYHIWEADQKFSCKIEQKYNQCVRKKVGETESVCERLCACKRDICDLLPCKAPSD